MIKILLYIFIIIIYNLLISNNNLNIERIYKNPVFKFIFLYLIYIFGKRDESIALLLAILYIYTDQFIKKRELLYNI
jgi:hypothetical protein